MLDQLMILLGSNLIEICIKEANIELRKQNISPDGASVSAGQIVSQTQKFRVRWY